MSLTLLDWRRSVAAIYAEVRSGTDSDPAGALARFREAKDRLFREHPDSPIPEAQRADFAGLSYWPYDPELRFVVPVEPSQRADPTELAPASITGDNFALRRIGIVHLRVGELELYWMDVYGGGLFLPFRDGTSGSDTYAAGRYLLDTVKGADLGGNEHGLVVDFNYAYHPSCAYDSQWSCPLAPRSNWLLLPLRAGEMLKPQP